MKKAEAQMPSRMTIINMQMHHGECQLCGGWKVIDCAVPYYEEPVHLEMGTVLPNGDKVGGMQCCKECLGKHDARQP